MNKGELRTTVAEYLHRNDFSATLFDQWVAFTTRRIGRMLRGQDNLTELLTTPTSNPVVLPPDFRAMRSVEWTGNNASYRVESSEQALNAYPLATGGSVWQGGPYVYRLDGFLMELRPFFEVELTIRYWRQPAELVSDSATNDILTAQPQLYLYGALIEGAIWTQDANLAQGYVSVFGDEVMTLNNQGANVADTPQMRG